MNFSLLDSPDEPLLHQTHVRIEHPELWSNLAHIAADEVYNYSGWEDLYSQLYGNYVPDAYYAAPGERSDTPRGGSGEGPNHEALRLWVMGNPDQVDRRFRGAVATRRKSFFPVTASTSSTPPGARYWPLRSSPEIQTGPICGEASISASSTGPFSELRKMADVRFGQCSSPSPHFRWISTASRRD